jgi:Fe-S oxidoreductase
MGPETSHQGLFTSLAQLEAQGASVRLGEWHADLPGVETGDDAVFMPGNAGLLDAYFSRDAEYSAGPHSALLLLNAAGVRPRVAGGGSGHDLYYQGRLDEFRALGKELVPRLAAMLKATGTDEVICASPEDAHALRDLHGLPAVHVTEFLGGREIALEAPAGPGGRPRVAFLDPCRLGRYRGAYDEPRELLGRVAEVVGLGHPRGQEPCCGVSAWVNCNSWSKAHREDILRRAQEAGVDALVTACPMCQVHMDCYYDEEAYDPSAPDAVPPLRIVDVCQLVAELGGLLPLERERLAPPSPSPDRDPGILAPVEAAPVADHMDPLTVHAAHLCTLCMRCVQECPQDAPVIDHVLRLRQGLWENGRTPRTIARMVASIDAEDDAFGEPRSGRTEAYPAALADRVLAAGDGRRPEVLLFAGCVLSYQDPRGLAAVSRVLEASGVDHAILGEEEGCCGYVDHLAGAQDAFRDVAKGVMDRVRATGARFLVTPCSGCFKSFSQLYPDVDTDWPGDLEVLHLAQYLDRLLSQDRIPLAGEREVMMVAYHDPCDLGRGCGVYDEPRRVLAALPGVVLEEFPERREEARCCGGGGALRAYEPERSVELARQRLDSLAEGIDVVASACPSCKGNLRIAGTGRARETGHRLRVMDICEVVASRLQGGGAR